MIGETWTGVLVLAAWVADRVAGRAGRAKGGQPAASDAPAAARQRSATPRPAFRADQAALFTRVEEGARIFRPEVARAVLDDALRMRGAVPIALPGLDARAAVWAWAIVPPRGDRDLASEVVDRAIARGQHVVASLSIVLLRTGHPVEAIIVAAQGAEVARSIASIAGEMGVFLGPPGAVPESPPLVTPPPPTPGDRKANGVVIGQVVHAGHDPVA